jgi:hypothetical protein
VTEAAPQIELTSSTISDQIESKEILDMPLNGRDWAALATLSPGVNAVEVQMPFETGARRGNRGFGAQLTISGGKPTQNNYRLDGLSINDYANGGPGSVLGVNLGVDAIQEFSVITGNYSAEYGRASAGIVNAISKSGTNAFHGDLYGFLRSQKLDANDFFSNLAPNPTRPPYKRNQFGAAAGGPIRKDRTFIFGDYEGYARRRGSPAGLHLFRLTMRGWAYSRAKGCLRRTLEREHHARTRPPASAALPPDIICLACQPFAWMIRSRPRIIGPRDSRGCPPSGTWISFPAPPCRVPATQGATSSP